MQVIPAIDILDGKIVRLYQGNYKLITKYERTPAEQAAIFSDLGVRRIHLVDLDGAKEGRAVNFDVVREIRKHVDIELEIGGGVRDDDAIRAYLDIGVDSVILGTKALTDREFLVRSLDAYGDRIIVGLDLKDGRPAIAGWVRTVEADAPTLLKEFADLRIGSVIVTDIATDGALTGVDAERVKEILSYSNAMITLSGGVASIEDIKTLCEITDRRLKGVIVGKAIYDGQLNVAEAVQLTTNS